MLRFDHPQMFWLALLALPLIALGWRAMASMDRVRRLTSLALRTVLLLAIVFMLAGPRMVQEHDDLTVIGVLDISGSMQRFADLPPISTNGDEVARRSNIEYMRRWFRNATQMGGRESDDRFGLVVFDGRAIAISAPTRGEYVDDNLDIAMAEGTNIAEALRLGLAMFPADAAKRLVLVSDGNETAGDALEAIRQVAGDSRLTIDDLRLNSSDARHSQSSIVNRQSSIPIDVLPIAYSITGDVQVLRVEAPPGALAGQVVTVRMVLQAASPASGTLTLRREDEYVDLNGPEAGFARHVDLPQGQSVHLAQVTLGQTPINRFEAIFEPDNPAEDVLPDNNRAEAFTATPSKGSVLVIDGRVGGERESNFIARTLNAAELPASVQPPEQLPRDLLSMQNYDLIVLDNVPAAEVPQAQRQLLAKYVNDLGGGLIMVGGDNSFGAGGWNNTPVEDVMPVEMDPSRELRLPSAALVLVLDKSGSMNQPVAGARATQQDIANEGAALAIESLRADSLIGVVTFDMFPHVVIPLQPNDDPRKLANQAREIRAEGGTNMPPAIMRAYEMLKDAKAEKKRIVCMSDGRSHSNEYDEVLPLLKAANIQLTAIAVGDDSDEETMRKLAEQAGGEFRSVRDPRDLPKVLVDSVQIINKPLLKDVPFQPQVLATGSTLTAGMAEAPTLMGIVITSPRKDPKIALEMITPDNEPLLVHWQVGLGRAAAFTSASPDSGPWARSWTEWPTAATFWTQLARTIARPAMNTDAELLATIDGDMLTISYEITGNSIDDLRLTIDDSQGAPATQPNRQSSINNRQSTLPDPRLLDYLTVAGSVYAPDGSAAPVRLRQTAPGRYEATVDAPQAGNYIIALNPRQGTRQLAPSIGGASKSTSPEFRRFKSNIGLLDEIAESTGGRVLDIHNPVAVSLFDRTGMPRSESSLPIWPTILLWTLAVMLLDVACRRIAWDVPTVQRLALAAMARMTPSMLRGRKAEATLATLRRVSESFEQRQESQAEGIAKLKGTGRIRPPPERIILDDGTSTVAGDAGKVREASSSAVGEGAPEPGKVAAALDALLGRGRKDEPASSASRAPGAEAPPAPPPSETTSSLLAAKRRARDRLSGAGDAASSDIPARRDE
jgi:Ca-activated chloride channel homolog